MSNEQSRKPVPGDRVVLSTLPPGLLDDLPQSDCNAILAIVGKPVVLSDFDDIGRAELEFTDDDGIIHYIYVDLRYVQRLE